MFKKLCCLKQQNYVSHLLREKDLKIFSVYLICKVKKGYFTKDVTNICHQCVIFALMNGTSDRKNATCLIIITTNNKLT